ncbi:MAG TPA: oxidoreductase [Acidimicrobiales bacterium]|nr:oxidoreductase [Acidimicrobiales bacterium]
MTTSHWGPDDIGDLTGKVAVVTGANSGIGYETALELAAHGAHVVLACRDAGRGMRAADMIVGHAPWASVEVLPLDLASQASVREAAGRFTADHDRLDILVNNAGVMATPWALTDDGFERQFATNHLGPFAFTGLVLDAMLTAAGSRVVTVSSVLHHLGRLDLSSAEGLQGLAGGYNRWVAYGNTKLANLLFTYDLDRRLRAAGVPTVAVAAHPGWARTNLAANGPVMGGSGLRARAGGLARHLGQSAAAGALPTLYAATAGGVHGGQYFGPSGLAQQYGAPEQVGSSRRSRRADDAARLWALSEELTGVRYPLGSVPAPTEGRQSAERAQLA